MVDDDVDVRCLFGKGSLSVGIWVGSLLPRVFPFISPRILIKLTTLNACWFFRNCGDEGFSFVRPH